jgi:leukotriene-A4 hydrolase
LIGLAELQDSVDSFHEDNHDDYSCLCPKLEGIDPDDVFSSVPYEKGFNFLVHLEHVLGGPQIFEEYLKAHVKQFANKSINSNDFKEFLYAYFTRLDGKYSKVLDKIDWESWLHRPGMPVYLLN